MRMQETMRNPVYFFKKELALANQSGICSCSLWISGWDVCSFFRSLKTTGWLERSFLIWAHFNGTHTYEVRLTVSDRGAVWFLHVLCAYVCVCCRRHPPWHSGNTHTCSLVGPGTGRQLNRSAWGNLGRPAGDGRHAAGGSRTGENSNTSDGHVLCFTGRH